MTAGVRRPPFVAVVGNIAVGKTGLVRRLAEAIGAQPMLEEIGPNPFFQRFYDRPGDWAFRSQIAFIVDSLKRHVQSLDCGAVVQDRTVYETVDVFSRTLCGTGYLSDEEFSVLVGLQDVAAALPRQPTLMIHLHAPTDVIMERLAKRDRSGERNIAVDYVESLSAEYDRFVSSWQLSPVLSIDAHSSDIRRGDGLTEVISAVLSA